MKQEAPHFRPEGVNVYPLRRIAPEEHVKLYLNTNNSSEKHPLQGTQVRVERIIETKQRGNEAVVVSRDGHEWYLCGGTAVEVALGAALRW